MSETIRTSLLVPAVDERAGDGRQEQVRQRAATKKDRPTATASPSSRSTNAASAIWWIRSPNSADQLTDPQRRERPVEREADVRVLAGAARRRGAGLGRTTPGSSERAVVEARPARRCPTERSWAARARPTSASAGDRPDPSRRGDAAPRRRPPIRRRASSPRRGSARGRGRRSRTGRTRGRRSGRCRRSRRRSGSIGNGIGMMSPSGPEVEQEGPSVRAVSRRVDGRGDVGRREARPR